MFKKKINYMDWDAFDALEQFRDMLVFQQNIRKRGL